MSGPGVVIAGKFRLERVIGRGGMGAVWQARHLQLDMPVAVKFMEGSAAHAPDARQRFEREARAAAQIRTPHVVQVLDHGVDGDSPYIVMELLEGEDLGARLKREQRLSLASVEVILAQTAKGLRRAHEAIVHRDLKPSNIFLARVDDEEVVKLLDFGVAKLRWTGALGDFTQAGTLLGSPNYMSPEQARGHRAVDHRSDIWSLAVIAFRAIIGVKPFAGDSIGELIIKLCIEPPPVATQLLPGLPPAIDGFFARAFEQDPDQRFQSAMELSAAFSAIVRAVAPAEAIAPPPPPAPSATRGAEGSLTPPSDSLPLSAGDLSMGRAALADISRLAVSFEPTGPLPTAVAAAGDREEIAAPEAAPQSYDPTANLEPEVMPYLAGGIGGPAAGARPSEDVYDAGDAEGGASLPRFPSYAGEGGREPAMLGPNNTLIAIPLDMQPYDSVAPGGGGTLTTTSRTLSSPSPSMRRLILWGALAATLTAAIVAIALFAGGSGAAVDGASHAQSATVPEGPPPVTALPEVAPPASAAPEVPASAAPPDTSAAPPDTSAAPPDEQGAGGSVGPPDAGRGVQTPYRPRRPPGGTTKKRNGVDLGY